MCQQGPRESPKILSNPNHSISPLDAQSKSQRKPFSSTHLPSLNNQNKTLEYLTLTKSRRSNSYRVRDQDGINRLLPPPPCTLYHHKKDPLAACWAEHQAHSNHLQGPKQPEDEPNNAVSRRLALGVLIGGAALSTRVSPADAAYGEAAENKHREGFKILVLLKWNSSREVEYPDQVLRYEDNFDAISNVSVMVTPTDKKSIQDFGAPEAFLSQVDYLLGKQAYFGKTTSEGGFDPDVVATANILDTAEPVVGGKDYYSISVLTRTADGDEGGERLVITATVSDGKLYICKAQAGDKRWLKGARKFVESTASSFNVA